MKSATQEAWRPIESQELRAQLETLIRDLAPRLKSGELIRNSLQRVVEQSEGQMGVSAGPWDEMSLGSGTAGLCLLLGELDRHFPEEEWDVAGHESLVILQHLLNTKGVHSLSFWSGLTGIAMAAHSLSRGGMRYQNLITKLHDFFLQTYPSMLEQSIERIHHDGIRMQDYDTISGWSGIGRYLMFFSDQPRIRQALCDVLNYLVQLSADKQVNGQQVPGWYIRAEQQFLERDRELYPQGNFNLGLSHGILGPLALLSLALQQGIEVPGQREAIVRIGNWLMQWKQEDGHGPYWPSLISWQEQSTGKANHPTERGAWCYGTPGVARVLWLAGEAIGEDVWKQTAVAAYQGLPHRQDMFEKIPAPTFCHGLAGLLHLTQRMYVDSGEQGLVVFRDQLLSKVLKMYDPDTPFGYCDLVRNEEGDLKPIHNAGILEGATGTALILLSLLGSHSPQWDAGFLIR